MMIFRLVAAAFAFASVVGACTPSSLIPGGCEIQGPQGVRVHSKVVGGDVSFALQADTEGYVAAWFVPVYQTTLFPGDAVVGAGHPEGSTPWTVVPVQINGPRLVDIIESGIPLSNVGCVQESGSTTLRFTRPLGAGRFRLNPNAVKFYVAKGDTDVFEGYNTTSSAVTANLFAGTPAAVPEPAAEAPPPTPNAPPPLPVASPPAAIAPQETIRPHSSDAGIHVLAWSLYSLIAMASLA
jgi:hypothetical protein